MISEAYRMMNAEMHRVDDSYGRMGQRYVPAVKTAAYTLGAKSILDYGCGKSTLRTSMPDFPDFREYDPAIEGKNQMPVPADLVTCTDVMEHIEPEHMDAVLDHIASLARCGVFFVIACQPAMKLLPDGTNPHKIIHNEGWWLRHLCARWELRAFEHQGKRFAAIMKVRA